MRHIVSQSLGILLLAANTSAIACGAAYDFDREQIAQHVFYFHWLPESTSIIDCKAEKIPLGDGDYYEACAFKTDPSVLARFTANLSTSFKVTALPSQERILKVVQLLASSLSHPLTWWYQGDGDNQLFADTAHRNAVVVRRYSLCPRLEE